MAPNNEPVPSRHQDEEDDVENEGATENTPLLPPAEDENPDQSQPQREQSAESLLRSITTNSGKGSKTRWSSLLALLILCLLAILIMVFAFLAPNIVERYAAQAVVFDPTSFSIDSFTSTGVQARIQGNFYMDASRVKKKSIRDLGRFGMWIAREVETGESQVEVTLPKYGNVVLGTAVVPAIKVDVRDGHTTGVDFVSDLEPGDKDDIKRIAKYWIDGRLGQLKLLGKAKVPLKSGIFSFGTHTVKHEVLFADKDIPTVPEYDIKRLSFHELEERGMEADVSLSVENEFPIDVSVPPLGFQVLVEDCKDTDPYIMVGDAAIEKTHIRPKQDVEVNVTGVVRQLPNLLTRDCPGSDLSPLDVFVGNYIRGKENKIYVRGADSPLGDTPGWVTDLISDILVPVPLPGKTMGHLIKNFSLAETHFNLPDPFANPNTPESSPRISAQVQALVALPEEMNFNISTNRIRADAKVFYKGDKLGTLDLRKWQKANSTRIEATKDEGAGLLIESHVDQAPLNITDEQVFAGVIQDLVFGDKTVVMHIAADVDVQLETALGEFKLQKIPAEGEVPVKPVSRGNIGSGLKPRISDLQILDTTDSSLMLSALVNMTNPTDYAATVPYVDIHIVKNGSVLGHATARDLYIGPGENDNLLVHAKYEPLAFGGEEAKAVGRELLSQYISGWNTTISFRTHNGTIPTQPALGEVLSKFLIEVPTPRLSVPQPSDPDHPAPEKPDNETHFIKDATMHLISSTATFTLLSPLRHSTIYIEDLNATALYKGDDVGHILYDLPFAVPPIDKDGNGITSPRLPVDWSLGSAGYDAIVEALGGTLKLSANAIVSVRLEKFRETIWFKGKSIGAHVRL